jgi:hypothetical protein
MSSFRRFVSALFFVALIVLTPVPSVLAESPNIKIDGDVSASAHILSFDAPSWVRPGTAFTISARAQYDIEVYALAKADASSWLKGRATAATDYQAIRRFKLFDPDDDLVIKNVLKAQDYDEDVDKGGGKIKAKSELSFHNILSESYTFKDGLLQKGTWRIRYKVKAGAAWMATIEKKKELAADGNSDSGGEWRIVAGDGDCDSDSEVIDFYIVVEDKQTSEPVAQHIGLKAAPANTWWIEVWKLDQNGQWHQVPSFQPAGQLSTTNDIVHGDLMPDGTLPGIYRIKCCNVDGSLGLSERYLAVFPYVIYQEYDVPNLPQSLEQLLAGL